MSRGLRARQLLQRLDFGNKVICYCLTAKFKGTHCCNEQHIAWENVTALNDPGSDYAVTDYYILVEKEQIHFGRDLNISQVKPTSVLSSTDG